jgi:hypothetical protein
MDIDKISSGLPGLLAIQNCFSLAIRGQAFWQIDDMH